MNYGISMHELSLARKNKISLSDYNFKKDIENRLLMAQFSVLDLEILEEVLYSSIKIQIRKLAKTLDVDDEKLISALKKLEKTGLFEVCDDSIIVDKEMRKYYETQMAKFEEDFKPGMDFFQSLLRKVPIHVLPTWYSIPRSSNNIFDSLVEKYLLTPQIYQRYLIELHFNDPVLNEIVKDVLSAPSLEITSRELQEKHELTPEQFAEAMLHLEFNMVCCIAYKKENDQWVEIVTPFQEWRDYLEFLKFTDVKSISEKSKIKRTRQQDFSFILDMSAILQLAKKQPLSLAKNALTKQALTQILAKCEELTEDDMPYIQRLIHKLCMLKLADVVDGRLYALEVANDWLDMRPDNRAMFVYRHPLNRLISDRIPPHLNTEKTIHEAEKSIQRVLDKGWVYFDEFINGVCVSLKDDAIMLKRFGKTWKYALPQFSEDEKNLIRATVFDWLFETGIVATGVCQGRDVFRVTELGQSIFAR